jgi:hypothetical protein
MKGEQRLGSHHFTQPVFSWLKEPLSLEEAIAAADTKIAVQDGRLYIFID